MARFWNLLDQFFSYLQRNSVDVYPEDVASEEEIEEYFLTPGIIDEENLHD